MLKVSIVFLLIHGIPEGLLYLYSVCTMNHKKIQIKTGALYLAIYLTAIYLIRLLPISMGVNTLLILVVMSIVSIWLLHISLTKTLFPLIIVILTIVISEIINILILQQYLGNDYNKVLSNPLSESLYTSPTSFIMFILFFIFLAMRKLVLKKRIIHGTFGSMDGTSTIESSKV